jgi:CubicO group peptidase (beta-lactamase class C family)
MDDTYFNVPADKQPRLVSRFQRKEDGRLAETPRTPFKPVTFFSGGGGLFSTAEDYSKFARAILAGGHLGKQRILSPGSVAEMGRNQIGELPLRTPPSVIPSLVKEGAVLPGQLDSSGGVRDGIEADREGGAGNIVVGPANHPWIHWRRGCWVPHEGCRADDGWQARGGDLDRSCDAAEAVRPPPRNRRAKRSECRPQRPPQMPHRRSIRSLLTGSRMP